MIIKHSIIIVDDDADDRQFMKDAFINTNEDHDYTSLENGDKLLEYLKAHCLDRMPSLILLDLNMPGKDGREILKEIRKNDRYLPIPIIVFTTSSSNRDRQIAYTIGANCFITKPDTFNQLTELARCISKLWLH